MKKIETSSPSSVQSAPDVILRDDGEDRIGWEAKTELGEQYMGGLTGIVRDLDQLLRRGSEQKVVFGLAMLH